MVFWLWVAVGVLAAAVIALTVKVCLLRRSAGELARGFADRLTTETNTLIDVSCRDRAMLALAEAINDQLRQLRAERRRFQQGDAELKQAVTNISHDLRTPLTAICGYLELLAQEEKSEAVGRYLSMIENRTEALKQLTEELFRYSVIASVREDATEIVCLNSALEESLAAAYGTLTQRGIRPEISIPEHRVERRLNRSAVARIFGNLLSNAVKYSDGDLSVRMDEDGTIVFSNTAAALTPILVGRLFDRFYTVESGRNATGLGLSIAKLLTERMGGAITADYADGVLRITVSFSAS